MQRIYTDILLSHFKRNRQMIFLVGPRQVGKTTIARMAQDHYTHSVYLNWDNQDHRSLLLSGPAEIADYMGLNIVSSKRSLVVFDEIHKHSKWKSFLKGFYDTYGESLDIIVTGSSKLDLKKKAADSLMGRYFSYHVYPITVGEALHRAVKTPVISPERIKEKDWRNLYKFGGFPEPFLKASPRFVNQWQRLRQKLLLREDIRNLTQIQEVDKLEILASIIQEQASGLLNYSSIAKRLQISVDTARRWITTLRAFYFCFQVLPLTRKISRSLLKEPKLYLYDWQLVRDEGSRAENFVALHLRKAVSFWNDHGFGDFDLRYIRTKEKREVDFVITQNGSAYILVEVKTSNTQLSDDLGYFQKMSGAKHAFQVVLDLPYVEYDCFRKTKPVVVPARTFLSQLCI